MSGSAAAAFPHLQTDRSERVARWLLSSNLTTMYSTCIGTWGRGGGQQLRGLKNKGERVSPFMAGSSVDNRQGPMHARSVRMRGRLVCAQYTASSESAAGSAASAWAAAEWGWGGARANSPQKQQAGTTGRAPRKHSPRRPT